MKKTYRSLTPLALALTTSALLSLPVLANDAPAKVEKTEKAAKSPVKAGTVATVNGVAIPQNLFDTFHAEQKNQGTPDSPEMRAAVKEELVRRELLVQEAKKLGLDKDPATAAQMELSRQAVLIRAFLQGHVAKNPIKDADLQQDYKELTSKMGGTEFKSRHILVDSEDVAKKIIADLKGGAKFEELAKQSKDPGSKDKGGELGWSMAGAYVPPFADALTKLEKGKTTETPVKTDFGWHVIQLEDSRAKEPPPFEQVKPQLAQRANQKLVEKLVESLRAKAKVQ